MTAVSRRGPNSTILGLELAFGVALLGASAVAGIVFVHRPWENRLDVWGNSLLPPDQSSRLFHDIADIGSVPVLLVVIALAISISIWRDLARAAACAIGPVLAVLITEHVAKPLIGRPAELGGYSYPSGTVTAAAAIATVILLASPRLLRPLAVVVGVGIIGAVSVAVVAMRWHFATDAVGGACVGIGSVFTLDALFHLPGFWRVSLEQRRAARLQSSTETHLLQRV